MSAQSLIKATAGHVAYRFMNKNQACFEKRVFPSASFHPPQSNRAASLTAIVSNTIKSKEEKKRREKKTLNTYHGLRHRIHINTRSTCTTHTGRMDVTIDFWPDVRDAAEIQKLWLQKVFLSFESCNCSARPGQ